MRSQVPLQFRNKNPPTGMVLNLITVLTDVNSIRKECVFKEDKLIAQANQILPYYVTADTTGSTVCRYHPIEVPLDDENYQGSGVVKEGRRGLQEGLQAGYFGGGSRI